MIDQRELARRATQTRMLIDLTTVKHAADVHVDQSLSDHNLHDITPAQAKCLLVLVQHREPMSASELSQALSLSPMTISRFVNALDRAGWVRRSKDPCDKRRLLIEPTDKATDKLPAFIDINNRLLDRAFGHLSALEQDQLGSLIRRIKGALMDVASDQS